VNKALTENNFFDKIKNYSALGITNFASSVISAVFWIYLATILEKSEYGFLVYLISIASLSHTISTLGVGRTIIVYGAKNEEINSPAYTLGLVSSTIASIIVFFITANVAVSFLTWSLMIFFLKISEVNSKKQYSSYSKYKILRSILIVVIGISLYQFFGINGIILGFALSTIPTFVGIYDYIKKKKFGISLLKPKIKFMTFTWLNSVGISFFLMGDKILISFLLGFTELGNYMLASQYLLLLMTIPNALTIYLLPQESQGQKNREIKILALGVSIALVLVSISSLPFVITSFLPKYEESIVPAQILSLAIIPITINSIYTSRFFGKELPKLVLISTGLQSVLYMILIVLFGTEFGIVGIAVALVISVTASSILNIFINRKISKKN